MTELLEAAGVFVVVEDFHDREIDAVTLRATAHHPHLVYVNAALPPDRMRMTLAHELGHGVHQVLAAGFEAPRDLFDLVSGQVVGARDRDGARRAGART